LSEGGHSGLLIAVLGDLGDHDIPSLNRMRHHASSAMAIVLDVPAWDRNVAPEAATTAERAAWLGANGWRAVAAGPQAPLASVWQELGTAGRTTTARPRTAAGIAADTVTGTAP
jgi:hypothetical protein